MGTSARHGRRIRRRASCSGGGEPAGAESLDLEPGEGAGADKLRWGGGHGQAGGEDSLESSTLPPPLVVGIGCPCPQRAALALREGDRNRPSYIQRTGITQPPTLTCSPHLLLLAPWSQSQWTYYFGNQEASIQSRVRDNLLFRTSKFNRNILVNKIGNRCSQPCRLGKA